MKKILSAILALSMLLSMFSMTVSAAGYPVCIKDSAIRDFYNYAFTSPKNYNFAVDENGKEDWTSPNLQTGYGSFTVNRGTPVYDYGCYRIKYQTTVYQPQEYKNIQIEYSNPGVVNVDTSGISSGYMELKFDYVSEGTTDITITYTVGKCWNTNNGPGYNENYLNKTAKLVYNDVQSVYVPVDNDGDGLDDLDGSCLHNKDDDGYCTVENCTHSEECCPKTTVEPENPNEPAEPTPDAPTMQDLTDLYLKVAFTCDKNSSHSSSYIGYWGLTEARKEGVKFDVQKNDGSNSEFPVEEYPWQCFVSLDNDYWFNLYKNNSSIKDVEARFATVDHVLADEDEVVGRMLYRNTKGYWSYSGFGNNFTFTVTHK